MSDLKLGLYRHFKGGYILVTDVINNQVVYIDLSNGDKNLVLIGNFYTNPPEENPTGQELIFEPVTDFNNQLNMITTDNLVKELMRRNDNPFAGLDVEGVKNDKVFLSQYVVGIVTVSTDTETGEPVENFSSISAWNTIEEAQKARKFSANSRRVIMKRVLLRTEDN